MLNTNVQTTEQTLCSETTSSLHECRHVYCEFLTHSISHVCDLPADVTETRGAAMSLTAAASGFVVFLLSVQGT